MKKISNGEKIPDHDQIMNRINELVESRLRESENTEFKELRGSQADVPPEFEVTFKDKFWDLLDADDDRKNREALTKKTEKIGDVLRYVKEIEQYVWLKNGTLLYSRDSGLWTVAGEDDKNRIISALLFAGQSESESLWTRIKKKIRNN